MLKESADMDFIKKVFGSYIFEGLVLTAIGVVLIIWPNESLNIMCIAIGALLILLGLIKLIMFFSKNKDNRKIMALLIGIVETALGIVMIVSSRFFIDFFQIVTGVILIYGAVIMFFGALRLRMLPGPLFIISILLAILTFVLAVVMLINPTQFASFMTQLMGVSLAIEGISMIVVMSKIKRELDKLHEESDIII